MAVEFLNTEFRPYFDYDLDEYDNSPYILNKDFNEFSYFGKDNVFNQNPKTQLTYEDLLDWIKDLGEINSDQDNTEDEIEDYADYTDEDSSDVSENPRQSNPFDFIIGNFNISSALAKLHYLTNYVLKTPNPKTWIKKGNSEVGHYCARAVRMAMEAGGLNTKGRPQYGGDYGSFLLKNGWEIIDGSKVAFQPGDVCVSHGIGRKNKQGHYMGHISMYDGSKWVSDYIQSGWKQFKNAKQGINTFFYRYKG